MWNEFFEKYGLKDSILDKAYQKTTARQRSFFKQQIADLSYIYPFNQPSQKREEKYFSICTYKKQTKPFRKVLCIIEPKFLAINQVLAVVLPLIASGIEQIGIVFIGKINFSQRFYFLTALELAGINNIACASKKSIYTFWEQEDIRGVFWFGFKKEKIPFEGILWRVPQVETGVIVMQEKELDLNILLWAHPHIQFKALYFSNNWVEKISEKELETRKFFLTIGERNLFESPLVLGKGKETSWIWPDIERYIPKQHKVMLIKGEG